MNHLIKYYKVSYKRDSLKIFHIGFTRRLSELCQFLHEHFVTTVYLTLEYVLRLFKVPL